MKINISPYVFPGIDSNLRFSIGSGTAESIIDTVCSELHQDKKDVLGICRKRDFVEARQIAMSLIREFTFMSLSKVGEIFSNRDHSTVIYAENTFKDLYDTDKKFKQKVDSIKSKLIVAYV